MLKYWNPNWVDTNAESSIEGLFAAGDCATVSGGIAGAAYIEAAICQGCGICASECPAEAIDLLHYRDGQVVAKTSRRGQTFYGCNRYPKCKFATWGLPLDKPCPECGAKMLREGSEHHALWLKKRTEKQLG